MLKDELQLEIISNSHIISVGYQLRTGGSSAADNSYPYSLVVGGNLNFVSGAIYPDGSGLPYLGAREDIFVGGSSTGEPDLVGRSTGSCAGNAGCLNDDFDNALAYYTQLQAAFASVADNAHASIIYDGFTLVCDDATSSSYSVTVDGSLFADGAFTYYTIDSSCNVNAQLVINIGGSGDVFFEGDNIHGWAQELILFNILGSGRVINIDTEVDGSILSPMNTYYQPDDGVVKGLVIVGDIQQVLQINRLYCPVPAPPVHPTGATCPAWEEICTGLDFPLASQVASFRDFSVISFGSFVANTGDIQGRLAAALDVTLGAGYSIGYELSTLNDAPDNSLPYSLVVGRDLCWTSGTLYPSGTGSPYAGDEEGIFVGRSVCSGTADYLASEVSGGCGATTACLGGYFSAAQSCYQTMSDDLAALSDNVQQNVQYDALILTCSDNTDTEYVVSLTPDIMATYTYITTSNCNFQANWVVNIRGTDDVSFNGDSFPAAPGGIVYNVIGCGRTIEVSGTAVTGSILAPCSTLHQTGGVIIGKVVAGDITFSLQINKIDCPNPGDVTVQSPTSGDAPSGSPSLPIASVVFAANDQVHVAGDNTVYTVSASNGNNIYITPSLAQDTPAGTLVSAQVDATMGRNPGGDKVPNSSSVITFSLALFAFLALFF